MAAEKINVAFTPEELQAVIATVRGELESLTEGDWVSGVVDPLAQAHNRMLRAGQRRASKIAAQREP